MWQLKATGLCLIISMTYAVPIEKSIPKANLKSEPIEIPESLESEPSSLPSTLTPPRRVVAYDQRQDGHYNIRADLENFVILVVPSSAASGASLLDLLTQTQKRNHNKHVQKKFHAQPDKYDEKKSISKLDYLKLHPAEPVEIADASAHAADEFIEGRTPYRVDISSTELLQPMQPSKVAKDVANIVRPLASGKGIAFQETVVTPVASAIQV